MDNDEYVADEIDAYCDGKDNTSFVLFKELVSDDYTEYYIDSLFTSDYAYDEGVDADNSTTTLQSFFSHHKFFIPCIKCLASSAELLYHSGK